MKPRLLDLFCGAGGAAMGYYRAGFDVTGVDIAPQKHYPFAFVQADALEYVARHGREYDVIHASPPCQAWSESTPMVARSNHPKLIAPVRKLLQVTGKPYVIENVEGARTELVEPVMLCGTMFGLKVWRHRFFESPYLPFALLPPCDHSFHPVVVSGSAHGRGEASPAQMIAALEVPWMNIRAEARQAIPPAYTEWIGAQLMAALGIAT